MPRRGVRERERLDALGGAVTAEQLRKLSAENFWQLGATTNAPTPISGGEVLPESIFDTFKAGKQAKLPLIIGSTSDDASVLMDFALGTGNPDLEPANIVKKLRSEKPLLFSLFVATYYSGIKDDDTELGRQLCRDLLFDLLGRRIAANHCKPDDLGKVAPVYRYYFDYTAVGLRPTVTNGTRHGDEIIYPFGTGDLCKPTKGIFTDEDRKFSDRVSEYWFEFARTGTPASSESPEWLPHTLRYDPLQGKDYTLVLGEPIALKEGFKRPVLEQLANLVDAPPT